MPFAQHAKQPMKLVDHEHGGGRIVDRLGKRLGRDVDQDAKHEHGILLQRPLRPERAGVPQLAIVGRDGAAVQPENRLAHGHEIAHLRHELDDSVEAPRFGDKRVQIHRQDDLGPALVMDDPPRLTQRLMG